MIRAGKLKPPAVQSWVSEQVGPESISNWIRQRGQRHHNPAAVAEIFARDAAKLAWLDESFSAAPDTNALVISIQADMFEFDWNEFSDETWLRHSGFQSFGTRLIERAAAYGKPVLLIYGDSHVFRQSRPFPTKAPNVMGLDVPGEEAMHAVEVTADTATSGVFSVAMIANPAFAGQ